MGTGHISLGYYAIVPEPTSVTDADRERTMTVFDKVFAHYVAPQSSNPSPAVPLARSPRTAK
jgi:hypothetical protein